MVSIKHNKHIFYFFRFRFDWHVNFTADCSLVHVNDIEIVADNSWWKEKIL